MQTLQLGGRGVHVIDKKQSRQAKLRCRACGVSFVGGPERTMVHNIRAISAVKTCAPGEIKDANGQVMPEATEAACRKAAAARGFFDDRYNKKKEEARKRKKSEKWRRRSKKRG